MKKNIFLILFFAIIVTRQVYANKTASQWLTFTQAVNKAKKITNDKPIMLVVYLDSCPVCNSWFSAVNQSRDFFNAMNKFVIPAKMEEKAFLTLFENRFSIKTVPAFFFFTKDGLLITKFEGAPNDPDEFIRFLYKIKNYKELLKRNIKR